MYAEDDVRAFVWPDEYAANVRRRRDAAAFVWGEVYTLLERAGDRYLRSGDRQLLATRYTPATVRDTAIWAQAHQRAETMLVEQLKKAPFPWTLYSHTEGVQTCWILSMGGERCYRPGEEAPQGDRVPVTAVFVNGAR